MKTLEEKIIEILDNNLDYKPHCITGMGTSAKEIASMMKEFMEWIGAVGISYVTHSYSPKSKGKYQRVVLTEDNEFEITQYAFDELFDYWLKKVKGILSPDEIKEIYNNGKSLTKDKLKPNNIKK